MHYEPILSPRLKESVLCPLSTSKRNNSPEGITGDGDVDSSMICTVVETSILDRSRSLKTKREIFEAVHPLLKEECKCLLRSYPEGMPQPVQGFIRQASSLVGKMQQENLRLKEEKCRLEEDIKLEKKNAQLLTSKSKREEQLTQIDPTKKLQQQNNQLILHNTKLQAEFEELVKCMARCQTNKPSSSVNSQTERASVQQMENKLQLLHTEIDQLKQQKEQLAYMSCNLRLEVSRLTTEVATWKGECAQQKRAAAATRHILEENTRLHRFRELFYMCRQEKEGIEFNASIEAKKLVKAEIQIRKLKEKLLSFSSLIGKGMMQVMDDEQREALNTIRKSLSRNESFRKTCFSQVQSIDRFDSYQIAFPPTRDTATAFDQLERVFTPSIFCLYEEGMKEFERDLKVSFSKPVVPQLLLKLRAILDSRYNECMINGPQSCRFADFTYGFLEKFDVDNRLRKVVLNSGKPSDIVFRRKMFLCCLFHPRIQNHSEVLVFKQFLLGRHSEDESYYYLSCRNLIHRGPQLQNYCSAADPVVFVHYQHVNRCLNMLLSRYNAQVQNTVLYNINLHKKKKQGRYYIEAGYVMRALLEVYRASKHNKLEKLKAIFKRVCECTNEPQMSFLHFRELMELNFQRVPATALAACYRDTLALMYSGLDFFSCFVAAASERLYIYTVQEEFQSIQNRNAPSYKSNLLTLDSLPLISLGLEGLLVEYHSLLRVDCNSLQHCYQKSRLLDRVALLLCSRRETTAESNQKKSNQLVEHFTAQTYATITQISKLAQERTRKDASLGRAATLLTRFFGRCVRNFYCTLVEKVNERINREPVAPL